MSTSSTDRPIRRVLVANRGEIAVRVIRACRELGLETVQVFSEADRESLAVKLASRSICIGPAPARSSYLDQERVVGAALALDADAIHPGYGFLSENAAFAELCGSCGIAFVGPSPHAMRIMGDKASARRAAAAAKVPITPGSPGVLTSVAEARKAADRIGYPVMLKATAGGGGRGMRVVASPDDLESAYLDARREAEGAFGNGGLYVEKYIARARHIEIQVLGLGDDAICLGERDCSIQRRNQKLVEEAPSPALDDALRTRIGASAVALCREVGYLGAGTIEYLVDEQSGEFYFMEMNTRIQVEHPVTEMVTGIDLVKAQLMIAAGQRLPFTQGDLEARGHAIEFRLNAEDPDTDFRPSPGRIEDLRLSGGPGIRWDTHLYQGYVVPPNYDSLMAKLIVWGRDREECLRRAERALAETVIDGVKSTRDFHLALLAHPRFREGAVHTCFLSEMLGS